MTQISAAPSARPGLSSFVLNVVMALCALLALPGALVAQGTATAPDAAPAKTLDAVVRPFLWRVEGPKPTYLYGTIHLPDDRVTSLPPTVEAAIERCDALYTELPMDLALMLKAQSRMMLEGKTRLKDVLGDELYGRVKSYVESKGMTMVMFDRMQAWAVTTQLGLLEMMKKMGAKQPLDMVIYNQAKRAKKEVGGLETIEEQLAVFGTLTVDEQRILMESTLDDLKEKEAKGEDPLEELIQLYLAGDDEAIDQKMNDFPIKNQELKEKLMTRLLEDRNVRMADRIVARMQQNPEKTFFFAVGAAHYPGEMGILKMLRERGYQITRLEAEVTEQCRANEQAAIDAEIKRREQEIETLKQRRRNSVPAGGR